MKFLITSTFYPPYHLGGDATHVKYLAEELAKRGHEIHVMHSLNAYRAKRTNFRFVKKEPEKDNIFLHRIESIPYQKDPAMAYFLGHSFSVQKKFSQLLQKEHPDIVHHQNISLLGYSILEKKDRYLSLYTAHDYWLICQTNNLLRSNGRTCDQKQCYSCALAFKRFPQIWRQFKSFKKAITRIDILISPSDFVRKRLLQEIEVNSFTLPNFAPHPPDNIPNSGLSNYFLFVGLLEEHKGILHLLNVFNELKHDLKARLVIVGGGSLEKYVKSYIEKNSLGNKIFFLGFVSRLKLYSLYSNALALIVPSIWPENAPLVTLEAFSVGTPVIASNKGGLPEIIEKVDRALIFNNWNELKQILLNFSRKKFSPESIRVICEKNFSPEAYTDKYLEIARAFGTNRL